MTKFRKKPIVVEAEQWFPGKRTDAVLNRVTFDSTGTKVDESYYIITKQGEIEVNPGDWIINGLEGEQYPCSESIFEKVYEKVEK